MKTISQLPKAVQQELLSNMEKSNDRQKVRSTKVTQARLILTLARKYNFRKAKHLFGLN
jgi:hypothetical protein